MPAIRAAALAVISAFLAGCAVVTTADGTRLALGSDDFRAYVERVFREQNRVADELAFALERSSAAGDELAAAENELITACAGLNELATSRRDGEPLGVRRGAAAARRAPDCERATTAAEAALARRGPDRD